MRCISIACELSKPIDIKINKKTSATTFSLSWFSQLWISPGRQWNHSLSLRMPVLVQILNTHACEVTSLSKHHKYSMQNRSKKFACMIVDRKVWETKEQETFFFSLNKTLTFPINSSTHKYTDKWIIENIVSFSISGKFEQGHVFNNKFHAPWNHKFSSFAFELNF